MSSRLEDFRKFLSRHPKIHDEVASGKRTWQNFYEDWVLLGERHPKWRQYRIDNYNYQNQGKGQYYQQPPYQSNYVHPDMNYGPKDPNYGHGEYNQQDAQSYDDEPYEGNDGSQQNPKGKTDFLNMDSIRNIINYVKRIDPDTISRTLNTVSKVLQITQGFGANKGNVNTNFNSWWD